MIKQTYGIRIWAVAAALLFATALSAQSNLIPNWSFEELRWPDSEFPCPTSAGAIDASSYWLSAYGSVDYFNACSNGDWPDYGVPQNLKGWQEAHDGGAYAGIGGYGDYEGFEDSREFLWMELPDTLKSGQGYYWEAQVSLADSMNFAMSRLGAWFSKESTRFWPKEDFFSVNPQVENSQDSLLDDKENWMTVSGQFFADGGEQHMTIGFFRRDADENIQRVSNHPYTVYAWDFSSYYIDAVVLREDNSIGVAEHDRGQLNLYPNPSDGQVHLSYHYDIAQMMQWEVTDMAGRRVHVQPLQGNGGNATLDVLLPSGMFVSTVIADGVRMGSSRLVVL